MPAYLNSTAYCVYLRSIRDGGTTLLRSRVLASTTRTNFSFCMKRSLTLLLISALLQMSGQILGQSGDSTRRSWFELPMVGLLDSDSSRELLVEIASKRGESLREAPAIVSVITRQDIERYGGKDLADILRMVPGFDFAVDVNGLFSIGMRGAWAHEGKALLMINGIGVNDLAFGNLNFFGSYPAYMVERIEIIRGPGSVLYGGFAEVAVINVITARGGPQGGLQVMADAGAVGDGELSRNLAINGGLRSEALALSVAAGVGSNPQSTRTYRPFAGSIPSTRLGNDNAFREFSYMAMEAQARGLTAKISHTSFTFSAQQTGAIRPPVQGIYGEKRNNTVNAAQLQYKFRLGEQVSFTPLAEYIGSNVVSTTVNPGLSVQGRWRSPSVLMSKMRAEGIFSSQERLLLGGGYTRDYIDALSDDGFPGLKLSNTPGDTAQFKRIHSYYLYGQYTNSWKGWNLSLGVRYEATSFGNAFLPRASAVYASDRYHVKLLYGRSFRIPMPFQAYTRAWGDGDREALRPELATTLEVEAGYIISERWTATANLFYLDIQEPIVFIVESYRNFGRLLSGGAEAEVRGKFRRMEAFANLAYYLPLGNTSPDFLDDRGQRFLGFAPLKLNAGWSLSGKRWHVAPSLTYLAPRHGATEAFAKGETGGAFQSIRYQAVLLAQLHLRIREIRPGMDLQITGYNLLNTDYRLIQPYYDNHAPIPVQDRQVTIGIGWKL
jgi:outer membrane cobalamin receptor